jgi:DNA-binding transcriptional ArsR family regulator
MTQHTCLLDPEALTPALVRIGYYDDTKKRGRQVDYPRLLGWFVDFARKDLARMSPAELLLLREELRALQEEGCSLTENDEGVARHLAKTQEAVAHHLSKLTGTGGIEFGPFQLIISIHLPRFDPRLSVQTEQSISAGEHVEPYDGKGLLHMLARALTRAGDRLRHCSQCSALFVQARRKQQYCKRKCQQVASMRDLRDRRKKEREAKKTKRGVTRGKRRARDGKKRR